MNLIDVFKEFDDKEQNNFIPEHLKMYLSNYVNK